MSRSAARRSGSSRECWSPPCGRSAGRCGVLVCSLLATLPECFANKHTRTGLLVTPSGCSILIVNVGYFKRRYLISLGSRCSTIGLHPQSSQYPRILQVSLGDGCYGSIQPTNHWFCCPWWGARWSNGLPNVQSHRQWIPGTPIR